MNSSPKYVWVKKTRAWLISSDWHLGIHCPSVKLIWLQIEISWASIRNTIFKGSIFHSAMFAYLSDILIISHPTSWLKNSFRGEVVYRVSTKRRSSPHFHHGHTSHARRRNHIPPPSVRPLGVPFPKLPPPILPNVESLTASWQKDTHSDPGSGIECFLGNSHFSWLKSGGAGGLKSTFGIRPHPQYVSTDSYVCVCVYIYIYIFVNVCIYIYMYTLPETKIAIAGKPSQKETMVIF